VRPRALVLGASADALVAARVLARAGLEVEVFDEQAQAPQDGWQEGWIPPAVERALALGPNGLVRAEPDPWIEVPLSAGGRLALSRDLQRSVEAIGRLSPRDAARWPEFCARMARLARLLEALYCAPAPDPAAEGGVELLRAAAAALRVRALGRPGIEDLLRTLPIALADLLDDWFESDALKGALAACALADLRFGPRAAGTAFALLHRHAGCPRGVFRPGRSNLPELLRRLPGIAIRPDRVERIRVRAGRVCGVVLADGAERDAPIVVSAVDPRRTLLALVGPDWLEPELVQALRHLRACGVAAQLSLDLEGAPGFSTLAIAPSLDHLERAADAAKYGELSREPWLEVRACGRREGRERLEARLQCAPYALASGWNAERRTALGELALRTIARHEPSLAGRLAVREVLAPPDLEARRGWPQGQAQQAELALDQILWMRPIPALARYRAPVDGLYLCGAAMHPGPGVLGAAGLLCAREALRDLRLRSAQSGFGV
jgi:phytoene dehydrogenase-like protein